MIIDLTYNGDSYNCNLHKPIDISIPTGQVKCFYAPDFVAEPYVSGDFIGSVKEGSPVNFYNVNFNPHGNGTHTECLGHITSAQEVINNQLQVFHFISYLATVETTQEEDDMVISFDSLKAAFPANIPEAVILRTLPNSKDKLTKDYSGSNPPYLAEDAMAFLVEHGVNHLLIDLPSVDREEDGGVLAAHRGFWNLALHSNNEARENCTITELIYAPSSIKDGLYLLNIQIAPFILDVSPSKPILYELYN